jgi:hypothetical protein
MTLLSCIYCTTSECRQKETPIPLPFAMPAPSVSHPEAWPTDNSWLYVACPECRRVSPHAGYQSIQFDQNPPHHDKLWLRIVRMRPRRLRLSRTIPRTIRLRGNGATTARPARQAKYTGEAPSRADIPSPPPATQKSCLTDRGELYRDITLTIRFG